ncbi:hypothetical protein [Limosilactobacillus reuteri]|uniref:hypothetical protein n=1 Tax=Limosilactobacillus reuteri TaxID=1598 RepID=UPI002B05E553|nr:hypothetical protein [Limosilactobacillus reuteri]
MTKDDQQLKQALLNELTNNIATLKGEATTTVNGNKVDDISLIKECIYDLNTLKDLLKGDD